MLNMRLIGLSLLLSLAPASRMYAQSDVLPQSLANPDNEPAPVFPLPSDRQMKWQETEFYAFFHYGMNTYTDLEWGNGDENEALFAPTSKPDPMQWLKAVKAAGMKGGIAVVKHHDGFCLWPTATTGHNITKAGNTYGRNTNIPRDFAAAARKLGMKYGFYVSPWDRNSAYYGTDRYVSDVFLKQCAELANYGNDQFEMWFDGANGGSGYYGGKKTTVKIDRETYYDVPNLRDSIHKVCPNIILWGVGGEARWIGNESGWAGETNWSPEERGYSPEGNGMYGTMNGWYWLPGESDAKFTDKGWFWHPGQKSLTPERTFQMYLETVGRNSTLILNCPPDRSGRLPKDEVESLSRFGRLLRERLGNNLALKAKVEASTVRPAGANRDYKARNLADGNASTYWCAPDGTIKATLTLSWEKPQTVRYVALQEYIRLGQRVKSFVVETSADGINWEKRGGDIPTTTIGYKRILPLNGSTVNSFGDGYRVKALRVTLTDAKACPTLSEIAVY